jgi:ABC-type proline/glycine betaine transport system substrate-binding protein
MKLSISARTMSRVAALLAMTGLAFAAASPAQALPDHGKTVTAAAVQQSSVTTRLGGHGPSGSAAYA